MKTSIVLPLAALALGAAAAPQHPRIMRPVAVPGRRLRPAHLTENVTLHWEADDAEDTSVVNVTLAMNHPTVVLEELLGLASVDCDSSSVAVTFSSSDALEAAVASWEEADTFVLITNHLGDCDVELERGFFLGETVTVDADALVANVTAEKTDIVHTVDKTAISFAGVPIHDEEAVDRRAITVNSTGLTIEGSVSLPSAVTLFQYDPYVKAVAKSANIGAAVTLSGYVEYLVLQAKLSAFYVDIDTSVSADVTVEVDVTAAYSETFKYEAAKLSYSLVNIPGIINIGPALKFDIGVDLAASAGVTVTGSVGVGINKGNIHLDFVNNTKTSASGWTPTYSAGLNISEKAAVGIDPFLDLTVELEFELLSGLLDLSGGLTAQPRFNNEFTLTASQEIDPTVPVVVQPGTTCEQGVAIQSDFEFSLIAFVTQFWSDTIYSVTVPIASECYSWL